MHPAADILPHIKVRRVHLAYLNACRLLGGGTIKAKTKERHRGSIAGIEEQEEDYETGNRQIVLTAA